MHTKQALMLRVIIIKVSPYKIMGVVAFRLHSFCISRIHFRPASRPAFHASARPAQDQVCAQTTPVREQDCRQ